MIGRQRPLAQGIEQARFADTRFAGNDDPLQAIPGPRHRCGKLVQFGSAPRQRGQPQPDPDPSIGQYRPVARSRKLFLTAPAGLDRTELRADSRRGQVHYSGSSEAGWSLRFSDGGVEADVMIRPTAPPFIKKENQFAHQYSMVSSMHTAVRGSVGADGREYAFTDALGYADHCSGHLPRRTGWLALWLLVKGVKATGSGIDVPPATPAATPAATDHRTDSDGPPPYDLDHSVQARPGWSSGILGDEPSIPLPPIAAGWREATVRGSSCPDLRSRSGDAGGKVVELHPVLSA